MVIMIRRKSDTQILRFAERCRQKKGKETSNLPVSKPQTALSKPKPQKPSLVLDLSSHHQQEHKWQDPTAKSFTPNWWVLLGDIGTGKTSLVLRFVKGQFFSDEEPTIGAAFFTQILSLNEATVKFDIWDTAGQERYHSLAPMYYRNAAVAVVVYDISDMATFTRAKKWVQELQNQGGTSVAVMALVGNKVDMESKREVRVEEADRFARESGLFFIETSAKVGQNINELFYEVAKRLASCGRYPLQPSGTNVLLSEIQNSRRRSRCCT